MSNLDGARRSLVRVRLACYPEEFERSVQHLRGVLESEGVTLAALKSSEEELDSLRRTAHFVAARLEFRNAFLDAEDMDIRDYVDKGIEHLRHAGSTPEEFIGMSKEELLEFIGPPGYRE